MHLSIFTLLLIGCPFVFDDPDLTGVDYDGDGFGVAQGDCNDSDSTVYPGALEHCDGLHTDCSNEMPLDEVDNDGDGYVECTIDEGGWLGFTVSGGGDCDDTDDELGRQTFPGAAPRDGAECLKDVDGDDYGDDNPARDGVEVGSDCDDSQAGAYPGLTEIGFDGLDNNCDGASDHIEAANANAILTGENADDSAGRVVADVGDINGDGWGDFAVGTNSAYQSAGAVYLVLGAPSGIPSMSLSGAVTIVGEDSLDQSGTSIAGAGDINGDGFDDLLIGASGFDILTGAAYVVMGSSGFSDMTLHDAKARLVGRSTMDCAGQSVAGVGDFNNDGYDDIAVGAHWAYTGGMVYLNLGSAAGLSDMDLSDSDALIAAESKGDDAGFSTGGGGDVNGDGFDDFLIGAPLSQAGGFNGGSAYLLLGHDNEMANLKLSEADAKLRGTAGAEAGMSVAIAGDVDGDGYDDLLIGAPSESTSGLWSGAVYFLRGASSVIAEVDLANAHARLVGESAYAAAGITVAGPGDINGDGLADVLVGAPMETNLSFESGATYLVLGTVPGLANMSLSTADGKIIGDAKDFLGVSVAGAGDVNGDGYRDFITGAEYNSAGADSAGAVLLVLGGDF
ncbi:MAG: hypothetical protein HN348_04540 [Proteobacteria bacterium]|nr:hypothetical protein [Pseudomonadota bacterium]